MGATEAIAATILALCEVGDEVVTFEPYYDSYAASIALAGAVRRTSVLRFPDFGLDEESLRAAFSPRPYSHYEWAFRAEIVAVLLGLALTVLLLLLRRWGEADEHMSKMVIHGQVIPGILRRSPTVEWAGFAHGEPDPYGVPAWWRLRES